MKRRLHVYLPLLMIAVLSCRKEQYERVCCAMIDIKASFVVNSKSNLDLLNPSTAGAFTEETIDLFDKKPSGYVKVYHSNMDNPKRFGINLNPNTNKYQLDLLVNPEVLSPDTSITLIKFGD
jgi:hypothetical protein